MIAVIGEMTVSFEKEGKLWSRKFSGRGYEWAKKLRENGEEVLFLSVLPYGGVGDDMENEIRNLGISYDKDLRMPLNPAIGIDGEWFIRSSAAVSISTERLSYSLSAFSDIKSVIVSSVLLSYNPSASAILDAVSFLYPQPRTAIDTSASEGAIGQSSILERTIGLFRSCMNDLIVSDNVDEILSFVR